MAKKIIEIPTDTGTIDLGPIVDLKSERVLSYSDWNTVLVHRHYDPLFQKWGNFCSRIVTRIVVRADNELPIRWYHRAIYDFCYDQYDRYGDYYRILDNSFGEANNDDIYEVR
jgi:hypothetical protein